MFRLEEYFWIPTIKEIKFKFNAKDSISSLLFLYKIFLLCTFFMPLKAIFMGIFYVGILPFTIYFTFCTSVGKRFLKMLTLDILLQIILLLHLYAFVYSLVISHNPSILVRILSTLIFCFATSIFFDKEKELDKFFHTLLFIAILSAIISCIKYYINEGGFLLNTMHRLYPIGQLHNPINGVAVYALIAIVSLHAMLHQLNTKLQMFYAFSYLCFTFLVFISMSRTPLLSLVIGSFIVLIGDFIANFKAKRIWLIVLFLLMIAIFLLSIFLYDNLFAVLIARGLSFRDVIWLDAINRILINPLGYGAWDSNDLFAGLAIHPHNMLLAVTYYYGVAGGFIFLLIIGVSFCKAFHKKGVLATAIFLFMLITIMLDLHIPFRSPADIWFVFWLPLFAIMRLEKQSY